MIKRIRAKAKMFRKVQFFHIFRELNTLSANKSIAVGLNELILNSVVSFEIPPYLLYRAIGQWKQRIGRLILVLFSVIPC